MQHTVDLNLHGIVRLRLIDAPASIVASLRSQLDPVLEPADEGEADIVVRFDALPMPSEFSHIGQRFAGVGDGEFYVLDEITGRPSAKLPVDKIGGRYEMVCSSSVGSIPLLFELIMVAFWSKGLAPLHASAFVYDGVGVLVMGWPKGGKTGAMLAFVEDGAEYVGDEWIFIDPTSRIAYGLPLPIGISEWQWEQLPHLVPRRSAQQRVVFSLIHAVEWLARILDRTRFRTSTIPKTLRRSVPVLRRQLKIARSPNALFPGRVGEMRTTPEKAFLLVDSAGVMIGVEPCEPELVARQMVHANLFEMRRLLEYHRAHAFAFPDRSNRLLEEAGERLKVLVPSALQGMDTFVVRHAYGGSLAALSGAISPWIRRSSSGASAGTLGP